MTSSSLGSRRTSQNCSYFMIAVDSILIFNFAEKFCSRQHQIDDEIQINSRCDVFDSRFHRSIRGDGIISR